MTDTTIAVLVANWAVKMLSDSTPDEIRNYVPHACACIGTPAELGVIDADTVAPCYCSISWMARNTALYILDILEEQ